MLIVSVASFFIGRKVGLNTDTSSTNTKVEKVTVEFENDGSVYIGMTASITIEK